MKTRVLVLSLLACSLWAWEKNGTPVCTAGGVPIRYWYGNVGASALSGGRVAISWEDERTDTSKVYLQVLDPQGRPLLAKDGIRVSRREGFQGRRSTVTSDSTVFIAWEGSASIIGEDAIVVVNRINGLRAARNGEKVSLHVVLLGVK